MGAEVLCLYHRRGMPRLLNRAMRRMSRRSTTPSPLPPRDGVGASRVQTPQSGAWTTLADFLVQRFPHIPPSVVRERLRRGEFVNDAGVAFRDDAPFHALTQVHYYRQPVGVTVEPSIPFRAHVLHHDEDLLVVDKPHFLPVTPSGRYVKETLLARLRQEFGPAADSLVPLHRLDRDTAGVVLFSLNPATRAAYSRLFEQRKIDKLYEAVTPYRDALGLLGTVVRQSRIESAGHYMLQMEVPGGEVNAVTQITVVGVRYEGCNEWPFPLAKFQLRPVTGKRHQLRLHLAALGAPILGDGLYPELTPEGFADYTRPLQLLARRLQFVDPFTQQLRTFESRRPLLAWPEAECSAVW